MRRSPPVPPWAGTSKRGPDLRRAGPGTAVDGGLWGGVLCPGPGAGRQDHPAVRYGDGVPPGDRLRLVSAGPGGRGAGGPGAHAGLCGRTGGGPAARGPGGDGGPLHPGRADLRRGGDHLLHRKGHLSAGGGLRRTAGDAAGAAPAAVSPGGAGPPAQTGGGRRLPRGCGAPDPGTDHREPGQPHRPLHLLPSANRPVPHGGGVRDAPVLPGRPGLRPAGPGKAALRPGHLRGGAGLYAHFRLHALSGAGGGDADPAATGRPAGAGAGPADGPRPGLDAPAGLEPLFRSPYRTSALLCIGGGHPAFFRPAPGTDAAGVEAAAQGLHPAPAAGGAGPLRGGGPVRHPGGHGVHHAVDGPLFREPVPDLPPG